VKWQIFGQGPIDQILGLISIRIWIREQFFHFSIIERLGVLGIKYELKQLWMDHDISGRSRPSDNERRWRMFELDECFLVLIYNWFSVSHIFSSTGQGSCHRAVHVYLGRLLADYSTSEVTVTEGRQRGASRVETRVEVWSLPQWRRLWQQRVATMMYGPIHHVNTSTWVSLVY